MNVSVSEFKADGECCQVVGGAAIFTSRPEVYETVAGYKRAERNTPSTFYRHWLVILFIFQQQKVVFDA